MQSVSPVLRYLSQKGGDIGAFSGTTQTGSPALGYKNGFLPHFRVKPVDFHKSQIFISMGNSSNTTIPAATRRDALKSAIQSTLKEMLADAAAGRIELPEGIPNTADILAEYNVRLAFVDFLLNPPWIKATKLTLDPQELRELDADLDRLVGQVDAELTAEKQPRRGKSAKRK